jgi:hypothetical protein
MADTESKINIKVGADTDEVSSKFTNLRNQIDSFSKQSQQMQDFFKNQQKLSSSGLNFSPQTTEQNRQALSKLHSELNAALKQEMGFYSKISDEYNKQKKQLEELRKLKKLTGQEEFARKEKLHQLDQFKEKYSQGITEKRKIQEKMKPIFESQGLEGGLFNRMTGGGLGGLDLNSLLSKSGIMAAIGGAITLTAAQAASSVVKTVAEAPRNMAQKQAEAAQASIKPLEEAFEGGKKTVERSIFDEDYKKSLKIGLREEGMNWFRDAAGSILGEKVAGWVGLEGHTGFSLSNIAKSVISGQKPTAAYEAEMTKRAYENQEETYRNLEKTHPTKYLAWKKFQNDSAENLATQRLLGMGDEELFGTGKSFGQGFLNKGKREFTQAQTRDMASQIMQAGGTAAGAKLEADTGNVLSRNFDLTNAGSILGRITGAGTKEGTSKDAVLRILSEGMRQGLDTSKFPEIMRTYTQNVSELIYRSGIGESQGQANISSAWLSGLVEKTSRGAEAAQSGYEAYQKDVSTPGTLSDIVRQGKLHKMFPKLGMDQIAELSRMSEADLERDSVRMRFFANDQGTTMEDIREGTKKVQVGSIDPYDYGEDKLNQYRKIMGRYKGMKDFSQNATPQELSQASRLRRDLVQTSKGFVEANDMVQESELSKMAYQGTGRTDISKETREQYEKPASAMRMGDKDVAGQANAEQIAQKLANSFMTEFSNTLSEAMNKSTKQILTTVTSLNPALVENETKAAALISTLGEIGTAFMNTVATIHPLAALYMTNNNNVPATKPPVVNNKKPGQ